MIDIKAIHDELTKYLSEVAESYFDNRVDYYKPRYVDLQIKFSVDPATNEIIQTVSCGRKIPPRYIGYPRHMTRDQLLEEVKEEKKCISTKYRKHTRQS